MKGSFLLSFQYQVGFLIVFTNCYFTFGQDYEVADIDCAVGTGGKELLTARLRRPDGFRGIPIFADDRSSLNPRDPAALIAQEIVNIDSPCQIISDPTDTTGRVFKLRVTDFTQCGVLKRNGFIHVRVWFPQLHGVVMLSDQEVIIMCKPPAATIVQSKTAGFAGSIPSGARVSGIVEESPGRLEYEVALYRETSPSMAARSSSGSAFVTGMDSHELPVDQAVPIGTRLQLRAKINHESAWRHAKLMEVSVSPDPKNPNADGSVSLVKDGCRNSDLVSIIPKQPYRYKERTNEVVLDFEAFLLSNMGDRSTLWLHTQIKACMESHDCQPEFCMDVYHPSGFGRRKRRSLGPSMVMSSNHKSNATAMEFSAPLSQHWKTFEDDIIIDNEPPAEHQSSDRENLQGRMIARQLQGTVINQTKFVGIDGLELANHQAYHVPIPPETIVSSFTQSNLHKEDIAPTVQKYMTKYPSTTPKFESSSSTTNKPKGMLKKPRKKVDDNAENDTASTNFGNNIGFSVIMPSDYYRSAEVLSTSYECKAWATITLVSFLCAIVAVLMTCGMSYKLRKSTSSKEKGLYSIHSHSPAIIHPVRTSKEPMGVSHSKQNHKYARDPSIYRS